MSRYDRMVRAALAVFVLCSGTVALAGGLELTYLANSGVRVDTGAHRVVIDGLFFRGSTGFSRIPVQELQKIVDATAPYDKVDLILTTHLHADHFDPTAHALHLEKNPRAHLVTVPEIADILAERSKDYAQIADRVHPVLPAEGKREVLELNGVRVTVFNFHHGRNTDPPVQQVGFLVEMDGHKVLHVGDSQATWDEVAALGLSKAGIDVAFLPYWDVHRAARRELYTTLVQPRRIIVTHLPNDDAPEGYFLPAANRKQLLEQIAIVAPDAIVFDDPLQTASVPAR